MPDSRKHRGLAAADGKLFADQQLPSIRTAIEDYSMLLTKAYADSGALKLVGDHFSLTARQRLAVMRSACSDQQLAIRKQSQLTPDSIAGKSVVIDGFNLLITIETALSGGILLKCRDGCIRDMASIHGTYRTVQETTFALELIAETLNELRVDNVLWLFDKPVSNSGKLKVLIYELAEKNGWNWNADLFFNPDTELIASDSVVITADSNVLDNCKTWLNLTEQILKKLTNTKLVNLTEPRQ